MQSWHELADFASLVSDVGVRQLKGEKRREKFQWKLVGQEDDHMSQKKAAYHALQLQNRAIIRHSFQTSKNTTDTRNARESVPYV